VPEVTDVPRQDETAPAAGQVEPAGLIGRLRQRVQTALPKGSLRARFAHGAFWMMAGAALAQGLTLAANYLAARLLGKDVFGELGMIQSTVGMLGTFAGMGLGMTAMKHVAELRGSDRARAGRIIGMAAAVSWLTGAAMAAGVLVFADPLAAQIKAPHLADELRIGCLLVLLSAVNGAQLGALSGLEAFKAVAQLNTLRGLATFPLLAGGVWLDGLRGAVWGLTAAAALTCAVSYFILRRQMLGAGVKVSLRGWRSEAGVLWRFSLPALVSSLLFGPMDWVVSAILVQRPGGYGELGMLTAARQWQAIMLYLPNLLSQITLPILANLWGEGRLPQYRRMLMMNTWLLAAAALVVAVPVGCLSPHLMAAYGSGFGGGWLTLVLICVLAVFWAANMVVGQAIWASGKAGAGMLFAAVRATSLVLAAWLLAPWGATGLALAYVIAFGAQAVYQFPFAMRSIRLRESARQVSIRPIDGRQ
jgi:O-antigen/teichoic acid export membrane protein